MFIIQEESGKWKMLIDLRAVNAIIAALMGALQPDLPNPNMIPRNWHLFVIDLKGFFFFILFLYTLMISPDLTFQFFPLL